MTVAASHTTKPATLASRALALLDYGASWSSGAFARRVRRPAVRTPVIGMSGVFTSGDKKKPRAGRERRGADVVSFGGFTFDRYPMTAEERAEFTPRAS